MWFREEKPRVCGSAGDSNLDGHEAISMSCQTPTIAALKDQSAFWRAKMAESLDGGRVVKMKVYQNIVCYSMVYMYGRTLTEKYRGLLVT